MAAAAPQPTIVQKPIPFPRERKEQMAAYARRHYDIDSYRLRDPKVIVEHYTVTATFQQTFNTFAPNNPDPSSRSYPGTCAHYVIDRDGTIYQLVPRSIMCRHTVGLNYTSFGIEHVGESDGDVMGNKRQLAASLRLTRWLRCRYGIATKRRDRAQRVAVLAVPHGARRAAARTQTHGDMTKTTMRKYRSQLGAC